MHNCLRHTYEHISSTPDNPFGDDILERRRFANLLTSIATNYSNGFVMAINGAWGTGKTVFIHQWKNLLSKSFKVTIFNAWDNDYFGEPTLAILSQLREFFDEEKSLSEKAFAAWKTLQQVPLSVIKGKMHQYISKAITDEAIRNIEDIYKHNLNYDIDYKESDIISYVSQRVDFIKYKNALIDFAAEIVKDGKPLIFIIDELDRCTPSYAVEVLEKIKHLFNIPNIVFCLTIDKQQLIKSIQGYYGSYNFNGEEYLRRFFDIELELPQVKHQSFAFMLSEHFGINQYIRSNDDLFEFNRICAEMAEKQNLTLRQLEKFYAHAKLVFSYYRLEKAEWIVAILLIVHKFSNITFEDIRRRNTDLEQYARNFKHFFDFSENGKGANKLGAFLYHIDVYLNPGHLISPPEDFKFTWSYEFSEKQLDAMSRSYIAESRERYGVPTLDKIMSKILFIEQHISRP